MTKFNRNRWFFLDSLKINLSISKKTSYKLIIIFIIFLFIFFYPSINGPFLWDGIGFIKDNSIIRSPNGWWLSWVSKKNVDYWPITYTYFWAMFQLFGLKTLYYHVGNIILHFLNTSILFLILKELKFKHCFFLVLVFCFHPLQMETVTWIFQAKTLLGTLFGFLSFYRFILFFKYERKQDYLWFNLLFFASLLSKPVFIFAPFAFLIFYYIKKLPARKFLDLIYIFSGSFLLGLINLKWDSINPNTIDPNNYVSGFLPKIILIGKASFFYLEKFFIPYQLTSIYPKFDIFGLGLLDFVPFISLSIFSVLLFWKDKRMFLMISGFFFSMLPVLGIVSVTHMRMSYVTNHWVYHSLIFLVVIIDHLISKVSSQRVVNIIYSFSIVVLLILSYSTQEIYADRYLFWKDNVEKNQSSYHGYYNLGLVSFEKGELEDAKNYYQKALSLNPRYEFAYNNLGVVFQKEKNYKDAISYFKEAVRLNPQNVNYLVNLANSYYYNLEYEKSLSIIEEVVKFKKNPEYFVLYGNNLFQLKQYRNAQKVYEVALKQYPDNQKLIKNNLEAFKRIKE